MRVLRLNEEHILPNFYELFRGSLGAFTHWQVIVGLVMGGLFAAPFAAWLCKKLHAKTLLIMVGVLISSLSVLNIYRSLL